MTIVLRYDDQQVESSRVVENVGQSCVRGSPSNCSSGDRFVCNTNGIRPAGNPFITAADVSFKMYRKTSVGVEVMQGWKITCRYRLRYLSRSTSVVADVVLLNWQKLGLKYAGKVTIGVYLSPGGTRNRYSFLVIPAMCLRFGSEASSYMAVCPPHNSERIRSRTRRIIAPRIPFLSSAKKATRCLSRCVSTLRVPPLRARLDTHMARLALTLLESTGFVHATRVVVC